jgi:hypothetical protein
MKITDLVVFDEHDLILNVKRVTLTGDKTKLPYRAAQMDLRTADPARIAICQYYVIGSQVEKLRKVRQAILDHTSGDIDPLTHRGYLQFRLSGDDSLRDWLPPVVEQSPDDGVDMLLCDGAHRLRLAQEELLPAELPVVLHVKGVTFPYYARPNKEGWAGVQVVNHKPADASARKDYRIENYKSLFRDFNSVFTNVTEERKTS